jgi:hypothetical protein
VLQARPQVTSSPLQRVYRTKFALIAVVSTFLGITLIAVAHWAAVDPSGAWLRSWPVNEIGLGLFSTGLFGVLFHYVGRRDAEEEQIGRIRHVFAEDLAASPDGLVTLVSSETRDRIVENCLQIQLGDLALARDLYADLREQLIRSPERHYDMEVSVALAPWPGGPAEGRGAMFVATIRTEYLLVPVHRVMRFTCVSDLDEYRDSLQDPSCTVVHYVEPVGTLDAASAEAFELVELTVDGARRPVRRTIRTGAQIYTASLGDGAMAGDRRVAVSYTHRLLVQQHGHPLHLDISRPAKGLKVQFAFGGCRHPPRQRPGLHRRQPPDPAVPAARIGTDAEHRAGIRRLGAAKAGIAFVSVLEREMALMPEHDAHLTAHAPD